MNLFNSFIGALIGNLIAQLLFSLLTSRNDSDEEYEDENGQGAKFFPATSVEITAPGCGHLMYGQITQMDYGQTDFTSYVAKRVPKLIVDQGNDLRKLRYACRPLAAPKNYTPWIYMESVIG